MEADYMHYKNLGWEVWSFDKNECEKYGLNYNKTIMAASCVPSRRGVACNAPAFDVFFFGRDKDRKYKILKIKELLDKQNITNQIKIVDSEVTVAAYDEILHKTQQAKAILDVPLEGQEGITQREMEALFFGKKLLTTNSVVKIRDYYHPNNIFVIDFNENPEKITEFMQKPYVPVDKEIIDSYSIEAWVERFTNLPSFENLTDFRKFQRKSIFKAIKTAFKICHKSKIQKIKIPKKRIKTGRIAVYMVNTSNYDKVFDPLVISENCDYFLFTDNPNVDVKIWQVILIDKSVSSYYNTPLLCSRYYKMLPHRFLSEKYDYSIYLDAKNLIIGDIAQLINFLGNDKNMESLAVTFAVIRHNVRQNITEEKWRCIELGFIPADVAEKQIADELSQGFPDDFGLVDCRCLVRKHSDKHLQQAMETWFAEFEKYPYRDQLSVMFSLWKSGFRNFKIIEGNVYNNQFIKQARYN
jgi:hypothetical protein